MANTQKSSSAATLAGLVFGAVLMVAGVYLSRTVTGPEVEHGLFHTLEEKGVPIDLGVSLAVVGVFLILFPVIRSFFIIPLQTAISDRTNELERTFSEAEQLRTEMTSMRSEYERRLVEKESEAREQIQAQIKEAQSLRQTLMNEATAKADEMVRRANQEIETERARVLGEMRLEVVNLTLAATEKLLGENIDSEKNRRLVNEFIDSVEVKS